MYCVRFSCPRMDLLCFLYTWQQTLQSLESSISSANTPLHLDGAVITPTHPAQPGYNLCRSITTQELLQFPSPTPNSSYMFQLNRHMLPIYFHNEVMAYSWLVFHSFSASICVEHHTTLRPCKPCTFLQWVMPSISGLHYLFILGGFSETLHVWFVSPPLNLALFGMSFWTLY